MNTIKNTLKDVKEKMLDLNRDEFEKNIEEKFNMIEERIQTLSNKAEEASDEIKTETVKQVNNIRQMQTNAQQKFNGLKESGENAWKDLREGITTSITSLEEAINEATSEF